MVRVLSIFLTLLLTSGCHYLQVAKVPLEVNYYSQSNDYRLAPEPARERQRDLLILLPGIGGSIDSFAQEGLVEQVANANIPVDVVVANAYFAYYRDRSFLKRLREDVVAPALERGYQRIHLAGISLGGFGSLLYWQHDTAAPLASVSLLTPYVGDPEYYAYRLDSNRSPEKTDEDKNIWPWLETLTPEDTQHWYLGRADDDKFYRANTALAQLIPADNTVTVAGGHDWRTWRDLWPPILQRLERDFFSQPSPEAL